MAKRKTAAELMAEAKRKFEKEMAEVRELQKKEKASAKKAEEKLVMKLGRIVLDFQAAGFSGFNKSEFIKQVNDLVAEQNTPADAQDGDVKGEDVQADANQADAVNEAEGASVDGSSDTSAEAETTATTENSSRGMFGARNY